MQYAKLLESTRLLELIKIFRSDVLPKKIIASLRLWSILSVLPEIIESIVDAGIERGLWEDLEKFIFYLATNRQDKILPVGYAMTGMEGAKKAFITDANQDIILWRTYGSSRVVKELAPYALDDKSIEVKGLITKYNAAVMDYLKEDYLAMLRADLPGVHSFTEGGSIPAKTSDSVCDKALIDRESEDHRLWSHIQLIAAITKGDANKIDLRTIRNVDIILLLLYSLSLDNLSLNFIFNLTNFAYCLTEYFSMHSKQNIKLLSMVWYRLSVMFWYLPDILDYYYNEYTESLLHKYTIDYYFNYFKLMAIYCFNNYIKDDERSAYSLQYQRLKEYIATVARRDRQSSKYFMFYQQLARTPQQTKYAYICEHAASRAPDRFIIIKFYNRFNDILLKTSVCPIVDALVDICRTTSTFTLYKSEMEASQIENGNLIKQIAVLAATNSNLIEDGAKLTTELSTVKQSYKLSSEESERFKARITVLESKISDFSQTQLKVQNKIELAIEQLNQLVESSIDAIQLISLNEIEKIEKVEFEIIDKFSKATSRLQNKALIVHTIVSNYSLYDDSYYELYVFRYLSMVFKIYHLLLENLLLFISNLETKSGLTSADGLKLLSKKILLTQLIHEELAYDSYRDKFVKIPDRAAFVVGHKISYSYEELVELSTRLGKVSLLVKKQVFVTPALHKIESSVTELIGVIDAQLIEEPLCQLDGDVLPRKIPVL